MLSLLRRYTDSWIARVLFVIMAISFVGWGISGDIFQLMGPASWIFKVGGETIEVPAFQSEYQRALVQQTRSLPSGQEPSNELRHQIGQQTLNQMIAESALGEELNKLRIKTPDAALAEVVRSMAAFKGSDGKFSRSAFNLVLQSNGYTETRFFNQLRSDLTQRQLLSAVNDEVTASDIEVTPLYRSEFEKRSVDMAAFMFAAAPDPSAPTDADLQRWYSNHPERYVTPEFRRIKAVELTPQSLASDITITDDELHTAYAERKSDYQKPEKRSAQVIAVPDEAKAKALATKWRGDADWPTMQAAARADGVSAITQDDATRVQFPDPDLAKAVFNSPAEAITGPVKGQLGWFVLKVTKVIPATRTTFDQAKDALRDRILARKAADLMYDRANKLDQLLGNSTNLDNLPSDLGVAGVEGTLDASGDTEGGSPAPIPGPMELRAAIVAAAFHIRQGDQPQLTEVQTPSTGGSAYYALVVESIIPAGKKTFGAVRDQVASDWKQDQRERFQNKAATAMMTAVQSGTTFSDAATAAGETPKISPLITRNDRSQDVPAELQRVVFGLKKGEATMVEVPEGFVVAQLAEVTEPDPTSDKIGYQQARVAIAKSIGNDLATVFIDAVRRRENPQINQQNFNNVVQTQ